MRIFYLEDVENPETLEIIVQQSSRLWNDATDQPLYNKAKEEYYVSQQHYQQACQARFLVHIDSDVSSILYTGFTPDFNSPFLSIFMILIKA